MANIGKEKNCRLCGNLFRGSRKLAQGKCQSCVDEYLTGICKGCGNKFERKSSKQWRCIECCNLGTRPEKAPNCGCGCGGSVNWNYRLKGWATYIIGHHNKMELYKEKNAVAHTGVVSSIKGRLTIYEKTCKGCDVIFYTRGKGDLYCSKVCWKFNGNRLGENSNLYKDGRAIKVAGVSSRVPGNRKYGSYSVTRTHRFNMSKHIGRELLSTEVVHHIDRDRSNNDINNLFLFHCNKCHGYHHQTNEPLQYKYDIFHGFNK